jgi:hypothetical protein
MSYVSAERFGRCAVRDSARMLPAGLDCRVKLSESLSLGVNKFKNLEKEQLVFATHCYLRIS